MILLFFLRFYRFQYDGINLSLHFHPVHRIPMFHCKGNVDDGVSDDVHCFAHVVEGLNEDVPVQDFAHGLAVVEEHDVHEVEHMHEMGQYDAHGTVEEVDIQAEHEHSMDVAVLGKLDNIPVEVVHEKNKQT